MHVKLCSSFARVEHEVLANKYSIVYIYIYKQKTEKHIPVIILPWINIAFLFHFPRSTSAVAAAGTFVGSLRDCKL